MRRQPTKDTKWKGLLTSGLFSFQILLSISVCKTDSKAFLCLLGSLSYLWNFQFERLSSNHTFDLEYKKLIKTVIQLKCVFRIGDSNLELPFLKANRINELWLQITRPFNYLNNREYYYYHYHFHFYSIHIYNIKLQI